MKVSGTSTLAADPATVWAALNDPAVLVRTIPGCRRLEVLGDDAYAMTVAAGVGSIKGVYDGQYRIEDLDEPGHHLLHAQGSGSAGTIDAHVAVRLQDAPDDSGGTLLSYDADATVGGMIGGVGQRMLAGVSKRMAEEFFRNLDEVVSAGAGAAAGRTDQTAAPGPTGLASLGLPPDAAPVATAPSPRPTAGGAPGAVYTAPAAPPQNELVKGIVIGAAAALAGAVIGGWIAGRRR